MNASGDELPDILAALEPYLSDIVLIGGWVPELYRRYGGLTWEGRLSRTTELDLLLASPLPPGDRPKLRQILESAGLRQAREESFPAVWVDADDEHTVVEFLTADSGPSKGNKVQPIYDQGWLGAVALRNVDMLLVFTQKLDVTVKEKTVSVLVPTLGAYVLSKGLSFGGRPSQSDPGKHEDKRAKDLVYLHDAMMAGASVRARVQSDLTAIAQSATYSVIARRAADWLKPIVESTTEHLLEEAAGILAIRERVAKPVALTRIRGAVIDLYEMVEEVLGDGSPH